MLEVIAFQYDLEKISVKNIKCNTYFGKKISKIRSQENKYYFN